MTFDVPSKTKGPHYHARQPRQQNQLCWATCPLSGARAERTESFKSSLFGTRDKPLILHMDCNVYRVYICTETPGIYNNKRWLSVQGLEHAINAISQKKSHCFSLSESNICGEYIFEETRQHLRLLNRNRLEAYW